ncbi:MAG: zinc metalloprotease HtpX [Candidatus Hodarchaeota archaeon]
MGFFSAVRTSLLFLFMIGLLFIVSHFVGLSFYGFLILSGIFTFTTWWASDRIVLRMTGAKIVTEEEAPELHSIVARLAEKAGLKKKPKVAIMDSNTPNAFATGRSPGHSVVAVTTGLMRILDKDELEAVLAHEIGHVKHWDILIGAVAAMFAGAIAWIARWGIFFGRGSQRNMLFVILAWVLAPIAAALIHLAISRGREYVEDEFSGKITGRPENLANALRKLQQGVARRPETHLNPATSHMFIVHPFRGGGLSGLFSTHPSTENRIKRLMDQVKKMGRLPGSWEPREITPDEYTIQLE